MVKLVPFLAVTLTSCVCDRTGGPCRPYEPPSSEHGEPFGPVPVVCWHT